MNNAILELINVRRFYGKKETRLDVLKDILKLMIMIIIIMNIRYSKG